ncbi:MAG: hypothetical protein LKM41_07455 [Lachnospiraceae bacterium]|jgi:hypothetical protein|nr:hypothetical protein [Lachnospiraceae bacterium]
MAKIIPYKQSYENPDAEADYQDVTMYGKSGVGQKYYFFKKGLKTFYLPLSEIVNASRHIEMVTANACTAGENLFIQRIYVTTKDGEDIVTIIPDRKQAEKVFGIIRERGIHTETPKKKES